MPRVECNRRLLYHCTHDIVASSTSTIDSSRSGVKIREPMHSVL